jgi:hypothetical protein
LDANLEWLPQRGAYKIIRQFLFAIALVAAPLAVHADPLKLAKTYDDAGTNPDDSKYTGTAAINVISDTTFTIEWKIGGETYKGYGMRMNDTLAAMYKVDDKGALRGLWTIRGENGNGSDVLTPQ